MELHVEVVKDFKLLNIFAKKSILDMSEILTSSFITFFYVFYEQQKSYITAFWDGDSYYPATILPVQS